ncbi:glycosyltransferase family 4 protein [Pinisolibacter aquiterrae]|uniref:glycosyltransferase family 4 protein n=1 Tax=Pinisolibacter aquiterrae TaxID=2815579 RepID=UPI001C3CC382|nr:glycosyltransferase family 1 protein [Pinisolibacter aquiterrae]MBV5265139.1 glycosyltransferase family 1 protein [Pinisolibacter aquiterrae]MCC8235531.1 glycosyltransferase family 1 protein [Pinisolibacter aquiterrae]
MKKLLIVTDAWRPQINGVVRSLERLAEELVRYDFDVVFLTPQSYKTLPCPSYPEIRLALTTPWGVRRKIEEIAPDYIHIATEGPLGIMARRAALDRAAPGFTTSYHTRFPEYMASRWPVPTGPIHRWLKRFHNAGLVCMVATESLRKELESHGHDNLMPWSRGVDTGLFHPRDDLGEIYAGLPRPIFLNVGRVAVEKNLEAFLALDLPGSKVVIGEGPLLEPLRKAHPDAHFLGAKVGEDLARHYAAADVFVFPSLTDTFGNVIVEALASGLPVAAYPVMGPIDIVGGTRAGALSEDLRAAALEATTLDRADAIALAATYSWDHSTRQFIDAIELAQERRFAQAETRRLLPSFSRR